MFDVGWTELLVIGALALIVVGPRDLPQLLRTVGQTVGKVKRMAREFQRSLEDAARDADIADLKELRDLKKDIGGLDFRQQAARAQSYLNQPVTTGKDGKSAPAASGTASAEASPEGRDTPETTASPAASRESGSEKVPENGSGTAPTTSEAGTRAPSAAETPDAAGPATSDQPAPKQSTSGQPTSSPSASDRTPPENAAPDAEPGEPRRASAGG